MTKLRFSLWHLLAFSDLTHLFVWMLLPLLVLNVTLHTSAVTVSVGLVPAERQLNGYPSGNGYRSSSAQFLLSAGHVPAEATIVTLLKQQQS
jgi:hypothetical protein